MTRILLVVGGIALAALAIWHPAAGSQPLLSAEPTPASGRALHMRPAVQAAAVVYVVGAVAHPGLYDVSAGARIDDAVAKAGGLLASADAAGVDLAARVSDGDEIDVPRIGEATPTRSTRRRTVSYRRVSHARRSTKSVAVVDVNDAGPDALAQVPGIGATIAGRIVEVRERDGPFASYDELLDVAGMTPQRLERAQPYLLLQP